MLTTAPCARDEGASVPERRPVLGDYGVLGGGSLRGPDGRVDVTQQSRQALASLGRELATAALGCPPGRGDERGELVDVQGQLDQMRRGPNELQAAWAALTCFPICATSSANRS